jgi:bifunctional non-homologous end joining protein LigD
MNARRLKRSSAQSAAPKTHMPGFIEPCDPTLHEQAPTGPGWVYEIKTDGYRAQVHIRDGDVIIYSRSGYDWTKQFAAIAAAAKKLNIREAIIDGEATVLGNTGLPDFQELRRELARPDSTRLLYHAFDLLYLNGRDLRRASLLDRKQMLKSVLRKAPTTIAYVDYLEHDGARVFEQACRMGLEGIIAKRADAPYRSGRQDNWIKLKCVKSDTFPIVAFVEKLGAHPRKIASLYVGRREGQRLLYAGKARSGYTETVAREIRERLDPLIRKTSPLSVPVKKPKATWVEPAVDAEIDYSALTDDGLLRAAVFKGLRDDLRTPDPVSLLRLPHRKSPSLVPQRAANSRSVHGVPRENILQLLPGAVTPSKEELAAYWKKVAKRALVYLEGRPLKLVRHRHGVTFYHRGKLPEVPVSVHQLRIQKRDGGEGVRLWVDDLDGLLGLVAMDAVELHPWNATVDDIERADRIVIDLDPGEGVEWAFVMETALVLREALRAEGLEPWPKLTGGKGLHLMAPVQHPVLHDAARQYARSVVQRLVDERPNSYLLSASPAARRGKIFLDYLRNGRGNTAIGAYSPRAYTNFPIACPVSWAQVEKGVRPDAFTMRHPYQGKPRVSSPQQ